MSLGFSAIARVVVPYGLPALGGAWVERSGLVTLCLEGAMIFGAFAYAATDLRTGSVGMAFVAAAAAGMSLGVVHAFLTLKAGVDAMVSGLALNAFAYSLTRFALKVMYESSSNSPALGHIAVHAWVGPLLLALLLVLVGASSWVLARTGFGLRIRAAGDAPEASRAVGGQPERIRMLMAGLGCGLAALGGASLVADLHKFQSGMSAGRGFLALVAVVIAKNHPGRAVLVASAFGALELWSGRFQSAFPRLAELAPALPYLLALLVVASPRRSARSLSRGL